MKHTSINVVEMRKRLWSIDHDTRAAIASACRYLADDRKVLQYITAPHEGISLDDVAAIRRREISAGRIPCNSYSAQRRGRVS